MCYVVSTAANYTIQQPGTTFVYDPVTTVVNITCHEGYIPSTVVTAYQSLHCHMCNVTALKLADLACTGIWHYLFCRTLLDDSISITLYKSSGIIQINQLLSTICNLNGGIMQYCVSGISTLLYWHKFKYYIFTPM